MRRGSDALPDRGPAASAVPDGARPATTSVSPERPARPAAREQGRRPVGPAAAEALRAAHEQAGHENAAAAKRRRAAEAAQRRALARAKTRTRHRGR
ncbi:DUF2992 family protein [Streptomyces cacaoi]|uniref:DUF2992 family protein n=1 Tax=Streptomyces cacaoi TaxID=1898 RepID=UPI0037498657